jgi:CheY-like chemotaxis protein
MSNILVIDDNQATCNLMRLICNHAGLEVITAFNAQEGIALAQQLQPSMIFVDLQLPGDMNGWEAISFLKNDANLGSRPIIAISAGSHNRTAVEAGSDGYLQKPFTSQEVMEFIERYN